LRKAEKDDIDALNVRSIKNSTSLLEYPTNTALVATFDPKAFNDTEYLVGGNRIINSTGKPTEKVTVKYLTKTWPTFYKFHICFHLPVLKNTNTLHICVAQ